MLGYNYSHHAKVFGLNPTGDFLFTFPYLDLRWLYVNTRGALQNPVSLGSRSFAKDLLGLVLVGVVSTFRPAEVAFGVFSPLSVSFSAQSKGVLPAFPDLVPLVHPSPRPLPEAGHTSHIRLFLGVSPLTPPSAGSLLTEPSVTIPGFLD
jgi:hypothetical protein